MTCCSRMMSMMGKKTKTYACLLALLEKLSVSFHNVCYSLPNHSLLPIIENIPISTERIPGKLDLRHPMPLCSQGYCACFSWAVLAQNS